MVPRHRERNQLRRRSRQRLSLVITGDCETDWFYDKDTLQVSIICGPVLKPQKMQLTSDPRRADRERRFKPPPPTSAPAEDLTTDYMNILGMVFSMCGLMMRLKWCAWTAVFCSSISFANSRVSDDTKQIVSSFMLSISAVVMSYLQNPAPMSPPWAALTT
uniref:Uncharacterized protein n=6 Tax=Noctuidae TaxID=7100 RepID=F8SL46_HELAM|nr:hypothetical protein [Helicoverpa armigera]